MPLPDTYGVLKGRAVERKEELSHDPHYQVHIDSAEGPYRLAINVLSQDSPSELEYFIDDNFQHPITAGLLELSEGFTPLSAGPNTLALDFIRGNLFPQDEMRPLPFQTATSVNDLNSRLDLYIQRAINEQGANVYAFGDKWPTDNRDKIFHFHPGNGIHDIHMNQGNSPDFAKDDGVWQDGGLLLFFPSEQRWVGIFLKFQSQSWHTNDETGHTEAATVVETALDFVVRIVAALVNPTASAAETVTLLNASPQTIDLTNWALADNLKNKQALAGSIDPGSTLQVTVQSPLQLDSSGGLITLLNAQGLKVDGVSYTQGQTQREGWTIVF